MCVEELDRDIARVLAPGDALFDGGLPFALGLSQLEGALWSEFVRLPPNRDLPSWVNEGLDGSAGCTRERASAFDRAHHVAAGWGLVADRMDDGQVPDPRRFDAARERLLGGWRDALRDACGDDRLADRAVGDAVEAWEEGVAVERSFFRTPHGIERLDDYWRSVRLRLWWVGSSAAVMLTLTSKLDRVAQFRAAHARFMFGLQCRDDAFDADDDRALRGAAVHEVLGVPRGALVRAAPRALRAAASRAEAAGFRRFAGWIRAFDDDAVIAEPTHEAQTSLAAMMIEGVVA